MRTACFAHVPLLHGKAWPPKLTSRERLPCAYECRHPRLPYSSAPSRQAVPMELRKRIQHGGIWQLLVTALDALAQFYGRNVVRTNAAARPMQSLAHSNLSRGLVVPG